MVNFEPRSKPELQTSDVAARTLHNGPLREVFSFAKQSARSDINGACNVRRRIGSQCIEQVAMEGKAHSAQIEVGFGDTAGLLFRHG